MSWFRAHLPALALATGGAIVLAGSVYFLDVVPRMPLQQTTRVADAGAPIELDDLELSDPTLSARDDEGHLPDGVQLYAVDIDYAPMPEYDGVSCIAVSLVELDGEHRVFEAMKDWELASALGDYPTDCISSFDGAPGTARISFVLPEEHGEMSMILSVPYGERVQVSLGD